jgi:hypothetical protein
MNNETVAGIRMKTQSHGGLREVEMTPVSRGVVPVQNQPNHVANLWKCDLFQSQSNTMVCEQADTPVAFDFITPVRGKVVDMDVKDALDMQKCGIGIWDVEGYNGKKAINCDRKELALECWNQIIKFSIFTMDLNQPANLEANEKNIDDLSAKNEFNGVQITHNEEKEILVDLKKELPNQSALPLREVTVDKENGFPNAFSYQFESAVTILTGKNGVGKSLFLNAIAKATEAKHEESEVAYEIIQLDCQMNLLNSVQVGKQLSRWDFAQKSMAEHIHYCAVSPKEDTWADKFPDENQREQAKKILQVVLQNLTVGDIQDQILRVCKRMYCQARLDPRCIILNAKDFRMILRNAFLNSRLIKKALKWLLVKLDRANPGITSYLLDRKFRYLQQRYFALRHLMPNRSSSWTN